MLSMKYAGVIFKNILLSHRKTNKGYSALNGQ